MTMEDQLASRRHLSSISDGSHPSTCGVEPVIRLRLHVDGEFQKDPVTQKQKYVGGEQFNDSVPYGMSYAELCHRINEKLRAIVSIRYQSPGEELDKESLVTVNDDNDLKELYDDYQLCAQGRGMPFRVKLFLFKAAEYCYDRGEDTDMYGAPITLYDSGPDQSGFRVYDEEEYGFNPDMEEGTDIDTAYELGGEDWGGLQSHHMEEDGLEPPGVWEGPPYPDEYAPEPGVTLPSRLSSSRMDDDSFTSGAVANIVMGPRAKVQLPDNLYSWEGGTNGKVIVNTANGAEEANENSLLLSGVAGSLLCQYNERIATQEFSPSLAASPEGAKRGVGGWSCGGSVSLPRMDSREDLGASTRRSYLVLDKSEVEIIKRIGEGAFGEVSMVQASLLGTTPVAVKWLKPERFARHQENFRKEANVLAQLNHPNVLRFYGIVIDKELDGGIVGIVTEYVKGGSLGQLLKSRATRGLRLSLLERCELALDAATGMAYLHDVNVVHFDLKPDNLLVSYEEGGARTVRVADFGLCKNKYKDRSYVSGCQDLRGTLPYMAPELMADPEHVNELADVWSMGVVMWELLTLEVPYHDIPSPTILHGLMCGNLRLEVPAWCEPEWRDLIERCLEHSADCRPTFRTLVQQLRALRDHLKGPGALPV